MTADLLTLDALTGPIKRIKMQMLEYLNSGHGERISLICIEDKLFDELINEQVEEEVASLLKIMNRFKEDLVITHTELQYGEPLMKMEPTENEQTPAPDVKEDSKHWEGVDQELKQ